MHPIATNKGEKNYLSKSDQTDQAPQNKEYNICLADQMIFFCPRHNFFFGYFIFVSHSLFLSLVHFGLLNEILNQLLTESGEYFGRFTAHGFAVDMACREAE